MVSLDLQDIAPDGIRRLTRAEYDRMVEMGLFEDERVELLRGVLVTMSPIGAPHAHVVDRLTEILVLAVHGRARVRVQNPIAASDDSEPEPDLALVPVAEYDQDHPHSALLVIEVADTSLHKDRKVKAALYAEAGVLEYWIVDLDGEAIEVRTGPQPDGSYASLVTRRRGESVTLLALPDVTVRVDDVLPRKR